MTLSTEHLLRTAMTLQKALEAIETHQKTDDIMFDLYRKPLLKVLNYP